MIDPAPFIDEYGIHSGPEHFRLDTRSALIMSVMIELHLSEVASTIGRLTSLYNSTRSIRVLAELRYYRHARGYLKDMRRRSLQVWREWCLAAALPVAVDRLQGDRRHAAVSESHSDATDRRGARCGKRPAGNPPARIRKVSAVNGAADTCQRF